MFGADFRSVHSNVFCIRKVFAVSLGLQVTFDLREQGGVGLWAYAMLSVYIKKSHKKCSGLFSQICILKIVVDISTANQDQHTGFELEMQPENKGQSLKIRLSFMRTAWLYGLSSPYTSFYRGQA